MKNKTLPVVAVAIIAALSCHTDHPERRIQKYFGVSSSTNPEQLRRELLQAVPLGTTEQQLYDRLKKSRISEDRFASWYPADKNGTVVFRTGKDTRGVNVVVKEYVVSFYLSADRKVRDIEVKEWLTGL